MNCLSINAHGCGDGAKVSWIRRMKIEHDVTFLGIQETWMPDYNRINIRGCWDSDNYDFEGVDAHGRSGGILSIWNKQIFQKS